MRERETEWAGVAIAGALGLGAGLVAGMLVSELLGNVDSERVRRSVGRLRRGARDESEPDPAELERAVDDALRRNPTTRPLAIRVRAVGEGVVELTGTAPDATARSLAGDLARGVDGTRVVVNRVLVEGTDVPRRQRNPESVG